jgi:hypothetical protein
MTILIGRSGSDLHSPNKIKHSFMYLFMYLLVTCTLFLEKCILKLCPLFSSIIHLSIVVMSCLGFSMMVHACGLSYSEGGSRRIIV